jgi:hypothetical protein
LFSEGIPARDICFKVLNAQKPGEITLAIEQGLEEAKANNLSILDVSFVQRGNETVAVFFYIYKLSKN